MSLAGRPALAPFRARRRRADPTVAARTRAGTILWLPRVGGAAPLRRAPTGSRRYWRDILPALCGNEPVSERRLNLMILVLSAKRIPHLCKQPTRRASALLVPAVYELAARREITAFEAERLNRWSIPVPSAGRPAVMLGFFLLLILWHGLRLHWFTFRLPDPPFPSDPAAWPGAFGLDVYRVTVFGEWWRALTALFLHADADHLFSNVGFGLVFFWALNRRIGPGPGFAFALAAGFLGNICNALVKPVSVVSLGFSTALFGAVGVLSGVCACDALKGAFSRADLRRFLLPAAAGLAFLAMLGGGGEARTDYAAHIFGFCAGFILGGPAAWLDGFARQQSPRHAKLLAGSVGVGAALVVVLAWIWGVA